MSNISKVLVTTVLFGVLAQNPITARGQSGTIMNDSEPKLAAIKITLAAVLDMIPKGQPIQVKIGVANVSNRTFTRVREAVSDHGGFDYKFDIHDEKGVAPADTEFHRSLAGECVSLSMLKRSKWFAPARRHDPQARGTPRRDHSDGERQQRMQNLHTTANRLTPIWICCLPITSAPFAVCKAVMVEPVARSLYLSTVEDEELTPETAAAIKAAKASLVRGEASHRRRSCASST